MSASSSTSHLDLNGVVDDVYFSALHDDDEMFPVSDEKYALELQLQEALVSSYTSLVPSSSSSASSSSSSFLLLASKEPILMSTSTFVSANSTDRTTDSFCHICMDKKTQSEMFQNTNVCGHMYCLDCIRGHVASKIKESHANIKCPEPSCTGLIGPEVCRPIVPKEVLERWENILCESLIMEADKFYCPFNDCSAMMVADGDVTVTSSECQACNRLFCAQCRVAWHCGMNCSEFQSLKKGERSADDILFDNLAKDKKWMRCSECKFFVEKVEGCQHISCRCGHHFCYGCGQPHSGSHVCSSV